MTSYILRTECSLTGEVDEVLLTSDEVAQLESRSGFTGWAEGELREIDDLSASADPR